MSTNADGTISTTITKQAGHGPYLWVVVWKDKDRPQDDANLSVFSFWEDAKKRVEELQANGHEAAMNLGVDNMRRERRCADCGEAIPAGQNLCGCNTSGDLGG